MARVLRVAALLLLVTVFAHAESESPAKALPVDDLEDLAAVAGDLARLGAGEEARELLVALERLGLPADRRQAAETRFARYDDRDRPAPGSRGLVRCTKRLRAGLERLQAAYLALPADVRRKLAPPLIRIDGDFAPARAALGDTKVGERWLSEKELQYEQREADFQKMLVAARRLDLPLVKLDPDPVVARVSQRPGAGWRFGPIELYGPQESDKVARMLRESLRAAAVLNWLLTGRLAVPELVPMRFFEFRARPEYQGYVAQGVAEGWFGDAERSYALRLSGYTFRREGRTVVFGYSPTESHAEAWILDRLFRWGVFDHGSDLIGDAFQPCLQAGLLNLTCMAYLGTSCYQIAWLEGPGGRDQPTRAETSPAETRLRLCLPRAGLLGNRRWLIRLIEEKRDPPWVRSMADQMGKIQGDELIKATLMLQYLSRSGPLLPLCRATLPAAIPSDRSPPETFAKALGREMPELEAEFRRWILGEYRPSLCERLLGTTRPEWKPGREATRALDALNRVRATARLEPAGLDESLCAGAVLHSRYLTHHPGQADRWPDAHEEYPDQADFTAEGAWAGAHSVIAPGTRSPPEAIEAWMSTFYHRLPLLEPDLLFVGWGEEKGFAVLDAGSLCAPPELDATVVWPPDGARDVPTAFTPELPNPVPGEDQSAWGYPVTFQKWPPDHTRIVEIRLSLHAGGPDGAEVPCHFSSPDAPTNPDLAPETAWCLIPRRRLASRAKYTAVAKITDPPETITWSFTTEAR